MRLIFVITVIFVVTLAAHADDAPYLRTEVTNTPSHELKSKPTLDFRFLAAHTVYAGALAFDLSETSRGVAHHCEESSSNLGPYPSDKKIVVYGLAEFAGVTTLDYLLKKTHVPGLSYVAAGIATTKHIHGGYLWTRTGCI